MRANESDYRRMEVAIYDLKTEIAELRQDKARLDWLMEFLSNEWSWVIASGWLDTRDDIDAAMKEEV